MKRIENCVLHIGTEKTGSTTIQNFLYRNRQELLSRGYLYPKSLTAATGSNHVLLSTYAQNNSKTDGMRRLYGIDTGKEVELHRERVERDIRNEIDRCCDIDTLILSNEHCSSRLVDIDEIQRLVNFLHTLVENIEVVVYLRPQHEMAISLYSTRIKVGLPGGDPLKYAQARNDDFYNHDTMLSRWERVVGQERLRVRIFDRADMVDNDLLCDFLATSGLASDGLNRYSWKNLSLSPRGLLVLERLNPYVPSRLGQMKNPLRPILLKLMELAFSGRGPTVDSEETSAFYSQFKFSNEAVRERYFPDRPYLFRTSHDE